MEIIKDSPRAFLQRIMVLGYYGTMLSPLQIVIKENPLGLARAGAEFFRSAAEEAAEKRGAFAVAVSGGGTPRTMHRLLAQEPYRRTVPWEKTDLFWVDDRCVPKTDEASNYGAAERDLLEKVPLPKDQIHPMPATRPPVEGAHRYEKTLKSFFHPEGNGLPVFDLIFLGIGTDGHTASLFPSQQALDEKEKWVVAVRGGNPDVNRLTLTFPVLNHARKIVFLVSGRGKASILKALFEENDPPLPARRIRPVNGKLTWLLDQEAAAMLPKALAGGTS
ncbi:MAG: 6-phosphogluconolactonase [Pseudomonadota bacterium]